MQNYDLIFVGAGLSSSATLYHILSDLKKQHNIDKIKTIAVIEKNCEFFKGIAYGNRSSVHSLTINPIKDFFQEQEKPLFFAWLNKLQANDWAGVDADEKEVLNKWVAKNLNSLNEADFDGVYIPRFLYGIYQAEKLERIIAECQASNLAQVDLICGEAIDTTKQTGYNNYLIDIQINNKTFSIVGNTLVLGTGSLDTRQITNGIQHKHLCIDDIYQPSLAVTSKQLLDTLAAIEPATRNILIIGANASASEIVHLLYKSNREQKDVFNKIFILATSGLPDRLYVNLDHNHLLNNLTALEATGTYTAKELMAAIEQDVKNAADSHNLSVGKIHYSLSDKVVKMQQKLNAEEALNFFNNHGWPFTRLTRRTSEDYYITEQELKDEGKLEFITGRFIKLCKEQNNTHGLTFTYKTSSHDVEQEHKDAFPVIINCTGAEHISCTTSKLFKNLLTKGIVKINHNHMGLAVDKDFAANDNLYILGPLMSGIYNAKFKFWHLENAKRLNTLASVLSDNIMIKAQQPIIL